MRKSNLILTIFFTLIMSNLIAQIDKYKPYYFNDFPNTPSTSAFLKYGNVENSEYTGANSPRLPLFTLKEGDITIPLNLNYISGNGIKVRDESSSVGLGWGIPIATITQTVWGGFDDLNENNKLKFSFLYDSTPPFLRNPFKACENSQIPSQYLNQLGYDKFTYFKSMRTMLPIDGYFRNYNTGYTEYDTSPDIFICNLFGEKLEFVTKNFATNLYPSSPLTLQFECINKKGYKIDYNTTDLFIITNPAGIRYYFGKAEIYGSGFVANSGQLIVAPVHGRNFVLTKIIDKNNRTIIIDYKENLDVKLIPNYTQNLNLTLSHNQYTHSDSSFPGNIYYTGDCSPINGYSEEYFGNYDNGNSYQPYISSIIPGEYRIPIPINGGSTHKNLLLIKSISGDFGEIDFQYSNRIDYTSSKLDRVIIKNNINQTIKKIDFSYSYFDSQNSKTVRTEANLLLINPLGTGSSLPQEYFNKRLKLNSISVNDNENYYFQYNPTMLPDKDSFAVDYWGYFNGRINNKTLFPNPTDFDLNGNGDINAPLNDRNNNLKHADLNFIKAGILEKIIYPTKGYSVFNYELNTADNLFKTDFPTTISEGNGLRLKQQTNYDSNDNILTQTNFEYEGGKSLNSIDLFKKYTYKLLEEPSYGSGSNIFYTHNFITLAMLASSDRSVSPLSSGDGIGYSIVTRKELSGNTAKGKISTYFYNNPDIEYQFKNDNVPVFFPIMRSKADPDNGLISKIRIFDNSNILLKEMENEYYIYSLSNLHYGSSLNIYNSYAMTNACVIPSLCVKQGIYYPEIVRNPISSFSFFPIFSKESFLKSLKTTDYLFDKIVATKEEYTYNSYNLPQQRYTTTTNGDNISENFEYSSGINRFQQANILSENIAKNLYKNGMQILNQGSKYEDLNHFNPTSKTTYTLNGPNVNTLPDVTFNRYSQKGNLLQYTNKNGIPVTIIWGYRQTQLIAKIEGGTYSQIMQAFNLDPNDNNSYLQLGIVKKSDFDTDNTTESTLISELESFRNKIELKNFQITTYTYDPLIGVKSITPPSGLTESYEYDIFHRLKRVLDKKGNVINEYEYNLLPTTHYSSIKSGTFNRNNCGSSAIGGSYTYIVPAGQYISMISAQDADQKAQNDVNINGQNAANSNATCTPISCNLSLDFSGGGSVTVSSNSYQITFGFSSGANSNSLPWTTGVKIGRIIGSCKPIAEYSSYNGQIYYTIKTNGDIILRTQTGSPLPNNTSYNYNLYFPIN